MAVTTTITVTHATEAEGTVAELVHGADARGTATKLSAFFHAVSAGSRSATIDVAVADAAVKAAAPVKTRSVGAVAAAAGKPAVTRKRVTVKAGATTGPEVLL